LGHRQQLAFGRALQQRVLELQGSDGRPATEVGDRLGLGGHPRRDIGQADVADLAGGDEVIERAQRLLDQGTAVPVVQPVESDVVGLQAAPRLLQLGDERLAAGAAAIRVSGMEVAEERCVRSMLPDSCTILPRITEPLGDVIEPTLSVIAQGVKETALNGRTFTYGPGQFLVVSVELPVIGHITHATVEEPFLAVILELRPDRIAALLLETAPAATARLGAVDATPAGIAVSEASPALIDAIGRLLALLDAPDDAAALAAGVEREVLWRLLTGPRGTTVRQIGLADSRLAHLARAIRWIRGHYNETLRVEELVALATMSVSSFHRHFRAVTSMTPIQFQKQIRLREARATPRRPRRRHGRRLRSRLRQPLAVQPGVRAYVQRASQPRRAGTARGRRAAVGSCAREPRGQGAAGGQIRERRDSVPSFAPDNIEVWRAPPWEERA
jgi:AraC-like DNA-binding protein